MMSTAQRQHIAKRAGSGVLIAGIVALSGCMGPTYGTGSSQGEMLFNDLNNIVSLGSVGDSEPIAYTDRPELRTPENTAVLPAPQQRAQAPETAQERNARLQAEAYREDGPVPAAEMNRVKDGVTQDYLDRTAGGTYDFAERRRRENSDVLSQEELQSRSELARQRIAQNSAANQNRRRYLSEPPLEYRKPSPNAPVGDPGVDEAVKARRTEGTESLLTKVGNLFD